MKSASLVVLAAGMGRRYGGLKQIDPVGPDGELIIDYSLADAMQAGFERVVFVIRRDIEEDFERLVAARWREKMAVELVFQDVTDASAGTAVRTKPWGTGHAVLVCAQAVNGPFAVINADDYYGANSYMVMAEFMQKVSISHYGQTPPRPCVAGESDWRGTHAVTATLPLLPRQSSHKCYAAARKAAGDGIHKDHCRQMADDTDVLPCALVGFKLGETLTPHGAVARGICRTDSSGILLGIEECTGIRLHAGLPKTDTGIELTGDECVSMNAWGFPSGIMPLLREEWEAFIAKHGRDAEAEFYLPAAIDSLMRKGKLSVRVLAGGGPWFGVTHRADRDEVARRLAEIRP